MTRLVVHIGGQRTAEDIHRGLFANQVILARNGVLVPMAGRHQMSPQAVRHHLLPWSVDAAAGHEQDPQVWDTLAEEVKGSTESTVLLSSELFAPLAADPLLAPLLMQRLRGISDDVTVVFFAREQLGLLNSLYCHGVKTFELTVDFDTFVEQAADARLGDLESMRWWYEGAGVRFVAVPWDQYGEGDALATLLTEADIPLDLSELRGASETYGEDLGPVGIEATRLLGAYLRGRFPDFQPMEPAARRLRRRASTSAQAKGWCAEEFWGWSPRQADRAVARFADSNQEFARRTWGGDWGLVAPLDHPHNVAELVELSPGTVHRVHKWVNDMEQVFIRLRAKGDAA